MGQPGDGGDNGSDSACIRASLVDPHTFAVLFERHAGSLHRYLARRIEAVAVDDVLSETFVIAFRTRHAYDDAYPDARPWLFGIATNVVRHHRRSEARRARMIGRVGATASRDHLAPDTADEVVARLDRENVVQQMRTVLALLDDKYADVLTLFTGPQLTYEEIARALTIPVGTVRSRLSRGRTQLRELLRVGGQQPDEAAPARSHLAEERPK